MNQRINQINQVLPNTPSYRKSSVLREWIESTDSRMRYYKFEHYRLLKEAATLLELALWKAKLDKGNKKNMPDDFSKGKTNIATTNVDDVRKDNRITSGASIAEHFVEEGYSLASDATTSAIDATGPFLNGLTNA
eukprot:scaffold32005_cov78-Skeletonema_dohrnii-CCMP3373.AAC.3